MHNLKKQEDVFFEQNTFAIVQTLSQKKTILLVQPFIAKVLLWC